MKKKIKILFLECVRGDAGRVEKVIKKAGLSCDMFFINKRQNFIAALAEFHPDVIISDDALPGLSSSEALLLLKQSGANIPLIVFTHVPANNFVKSIVNLMKQGASDYLLKHEINTLPDAIINAIKKHQAEKLIDRDLSRYMNTIDEVFFSRDMLKSEIVRISAGCESVYGYSAAEFLADRDLYARIYHAEDRHILETFVSNLHQGKHASGKYRIIHKDGTTRWIESKIAPVIDDDGQLIRVDGVSRDITQTRMAEDQLKLSEQRYRQIVETAQEGIWIINENLVTTFVNKKVCDMLGYSANEIIGKYNYDFKDDTEKIKTIDRIKSRKLGMAEAHESVFLTKSGRQVFCIVVTNGLYDSDGRYMGTLAMLTDITGRKEDEDALRRSEANLSAIIENTSDLVYSLDTDFKFITYNQRFKTTMKHVYGFEVEQGVNTLDLLRSHNAELAVKWEETYKKALSGETLHFVNEYLFENHKVYLSYSVNPIWETGRVIGLSCFSRDITQQKLNEAAIKKSAANLAAIIENTDANIYSLDRDLRYITFNKLCRDSLLQAYNIEIKPGDFVLDVLRKSDPESVSEWENIYANALAGKSDQFIREFRFGQTVLFLSFSINPIWENDTIIGLSCSAHNITRQKMHEKAIRKSEASLRTVFNNTDMACILIDNDRKVVSFNTLAQKFSDEQNRILREGYPILDWVHEDRRELVSGFLDRAKKGETISYQASRNINGLTKWFDITWAGIKDQNRQEFGYVFTLRDITKSKKLEIEREKITSDLLQRNKALEQFTYIISHNLRAPVANIIGLSALMADIDTDDQEICGIIKSMGLSANKLDEVISDLNRVLQINEDINENIELISLPNLIDDIKFSIRHLIEKERATISCRFAGTDEMLSIKSFIYSIFYNLMLNSIKYRKPGVEPVINISTNAGEGKICIRYTDNGRGIDTTRYAGEIFGLYKRFDTSVEGKGMGLFMVKRQVESLGGNISLESELNRGTEFTIEFPQLQLQNA